MKTSAPSTTIGDRLRAERRSTFVGREAELEQLLRCLDDDHRAVVTFVMGLGGIGKTRLLGAFGDQLLERGVPFLSIDCESSPPTAAGFLGALGEALGRVLPSVRAAAEALSGLGPRVVLALDQYEKFRLLDGWLRQDLLPALPAAVRLFLFARDAALDAWKSTPGWAALVEILRLGPLDDASALELLELRGAPSPARMRLARLARGHPLALELAARALEERLDAAWSDLESQHVIEGLAPMFLREVDDALRPVLEGACLVRRATKSVLAAMVPDAFDDARFDALQNLPFVDVAPDGLCVHETVRSAVAASLRALDPRRHQELRGRAWACLRGELEGAGKQQLWRYMADALYLIDRLEIRDAFFPGDGKIYGLETARPGDGAAILEIVRAHDAADVEGVRLWWDALPGAFRVSRDGAGRVRAFTARAMAQEVPAELAARDPIASAWREDARAAGVPVETPVLFSRRSLVAETGEEPSALRSAMWLDAKRTYLEYPDARRIYVATRHPEELLSSLASLGFEAPTALRVRCGDGVLATLVLDFGARGVLGWLAGLVDAQFEAPLVDGDARALALDGQRVPLTKLEFGVIRYLCDRQEKVVSREDLLRDVWGQSFGGSNVVDAVVKSLRKKLGARAGLIETVAGHGYRLGGAHPRR
jgi:hypothetical protein